MGYSLSGQTDDNTSSAVNNAQNFYGANVNKSSNGVVYAALVVIGIYLLAKNKRG